MAGYTKNEKKRFPRANIHASSAMVARGHTFEAAAIIYAHHRHCQTRRREREE